MERVPTRADCGLPERGLVLCCFNHAYKILPEVFAVWMRLLGRVPQSVLWLLDVDAVEIGVVSPADLGPVELRAANEKMDQGFRLVKSGKTHQIEQ